jgi:hypothetical protein
MLGVSFNAKMLGLIAQTADDAFQRWQIALTEARAGTYTGDHAAVDAVLGLRDYLALLAAPLNLLLDTPVRYLVSFVRPLGIANAQTEDIAFPNLGYTPASTNLDHSTGPGPGRTLNIADIAVGYDAPSRTLTVTLQHVDTLTQLGTYTSDLYQPANPNNVVGTIMLTLA